MTKRVSISNLKKQHGIASEMRRNYREIRRREINDDHGKILISTLKTISDQHAESELEEVVEQIQSKISQKSSFRRT